MIRKHQKVRVVADSGGDHPRWVRMAWDGVEFEATRDSRRISTVDIALQKEFSMYKPWVVEVKDALQALDNAGRSRALNYWRDLQSRYESRDSVFLFEGDSCQPV